MMEGSELGPTKKLIETWTRRPPGRSSAVARTRVLAGIEHRRRSRPLLLTVSVSAALGLMLLMVLVAPRWPFRDGSEAVAVVPTRTLHQPVLVYELSSGTTLYFTLNEETPAAGIGEPENGQGEQS